MRDDLRRRVADRNFTNLTIERLRLHGRDLSRVRLESATITRLDVDACRFRRLDARGARLTGRVRRCSFFQCDFANAGMAVSFEECRFVSCVFEGAGGLTLCECQVERCRMLDSSTTINGGLVAKSTLDGGVLLQGAMLQDNTIIRADQRRSRPVETSAHEEESWVSAPPTYRAIGSFLGAPKGEPVAAGVGVVKFAWKLLFQARDQLPKMEDSRYWDMRTRLERSNLGLPEDAATVMRVLLRLDTSRTGLVCPTMDYLRHKTRLSTSRIDRAFADLRRHRWVVNRIVDPVHAVFFETPDLRA